MLWLAWLSLWALKLLMGYKLVVMLLMGSMMDLLELLLEIGVLLGS